MSDKPIKIILLNGPPASGKDLIARSLLQRYKNSIHMEFKHRLFEISRAVTGIHPSAWEDRYASRHHKEMPWVQLPKNKSTGDHHSQRSWLGYLSENIIKPNLGDDYFGKYAADSIHEDAKLMNTFGGNRSFYVFSDSGFEVEAESILDIPNSEVHLVRLYRDGCSFDGDTRSYLFGIEGYKSISHTNNNGTIAEVIEEISTIANLGD
tara:strand:+ start:3267 stop:3890 length:624 start_codon:yes stop_codon:yes gene_type:complete